MIPVAGAVRIGESRVQGFRVPVPFPLLWAVLFPLLLVVTPIVFVACLLVRVNPFRMIGALFQIVAALQGTHVEVTNDRFSVLLNIF
jgi:hypothetical protein